MQSASTQSTRGHGAYLALTRRLRQASATRVAYCKGREGSRAPSAQDDARSAAPLGEQHVVLPFRPR